jgi:hypothetical protein
MTVAGANSAVSDFRWLKSVAGFGSVAHRAVHGRALKPFAC